MWTRRKSSEDPVFQPPASVATRRDHIDKAIEVENESRPLWAKVVLGLATAALLPGAFGGYDFLTGGHQAIGDADRFDRDPSHEQQALKFIGQSSNAGGSPTQQVQQRLGERNR